MVSAYHGEKSYRVFRKGPFLVFKEGTLLRCKKLSAVPARGELLLFSQQYRKLGTHYYTLEYLMSKHTIAR